MSQETEITFLLLSFAGAIAVQTWGIMRFFLNRIDATNARIKEQMDEHVKELHNRVNGVKDTYVSRKDLDREISQLRELVQSIKADTHAALLDIKNDQNRMLNQINHRLDSFCKVEK